MANPGLTLEQLKQRCKDNFSGKIEVLLSEKTFRTVHDKVPIRCRACGAEYSKRINDLLHGYGCSTCANQKKRTNKEFIEEIAKIGGGEYEALEVFENTRQKMRFKHLSCGHEFTMKVHNFITNHQRCPRCKKIPLHSWNSRGAILIKELLEREEIPFQQEAIFDELRSDTGKHLRFDFYLPDYDVLIEYDGQQHFKPVSIMGGEKWHKLCKRNDELKNEWTKKTGMLLIRIPYNRIGKAEEIITKALETFND